MNAALEVMYRITNKKEIDPPLLRKAINEIIHQLDCKKRDSYLVGLLSGLAINQADCITIKTLLDEIFLLDHYSPIERKKVNIPNKCVIEYAGSGKKGIKTMNISTAAALLASSQGAYIIKKGSHATSSLTGSSDFWEILGVDLSTLTIERTQTILEKVGFTFDNVERSIFNFNKIYNQKFYYPHILSFALAGLLGDLRGDFLVYGLSNSDIELSLEIYKEYGIQNVATFCSSNDGVLYMDELSFLKYSSYQIMYHNKISSKKDVKELFSQMKYSANVDEIKPRETAEGNVEEILRCLYGQGTKDVEEIICLNSGFLLFVSGLCCSIEEGYFKSLEGMKRGDGINKIREFITIAGNNTEVLDEMLERIKV